LIEKAQRGAGMSRRHGRTAARAVCCTHQTRAKESTEVKNLIVRFVREEEGQDLIEYAMLATLIALVAGAAATTLGNNLSTWYTNMGTKVSGWATPAS
jgi:pilus assembly protein Flp/PilA